MNKNLNKNSHYGIYNNKEYKLDKVDGDWFIFTSDLSEKNNGFEHYVNSVGKISENILRKKVTTSDLQEAYGVRMYAKYKGEKFYIMREKNGEVVITTRHPDIAKKLGFIFIEPFVYDKHVQIEDLDEIIEKQDKVYLGKI